MLGFLSIVFPIGAAYRFYGTSHAILFWTCVVAAVAAFWIVGVSHNFAMEVAKGRRAMELENYEVERRSAAEIQRLREEKIRIRPGNERAIPDGLSTAHMLVTLLNVGLLVTSFIKV